MRIILSHELTIEEIAELQSKGLDPMDYAAILCPAQNVQAGVQIDPRAGRVAVFAVTLVLPSSLMELPTGGVLDAQGNSAASSKIKNAMPIAPLVRIPVSRSILGPDAKNQLAALEAGRPPSSSGALDS